MLRLAAAGGDPEMRSGTVQSLKCCPCQHKRAARPQVLRLAASTGGGPETRSGPKCCPCQQKRVARLPSAAPGSIKGGAPKRAWAPSRARGGPQNALGNRPGPASRNEPRGSQVLRLAASRGGPPNALGHRPEPEVLPLPAETSREAPKCCAWQHQAEGPETRLGTVQSLKCCPCQQKRIARLPSAAPGSIKGGGPETRSGQSLKCCPCQQKRGA